MRKIAHHVLKTVATPLHFFTVVAALLAAIILFLPMQSLLPNAMTITIICISFGLFLILVVLVASLVIFYPRKLTFDQEAHLTVMREQLGDNETSMPYVLGQLSKGSLPIASSKEE